MAEWSKAVDLSPTISGCAGSNPAPRIFFVSVAQWLEQSAVNRKVEGSNPSRDDIVLLQHDVVIKLFYWYIICDYVFDGKRNSKYKNSKQT